MKHCLYWCLCTLAAAVLLAAPDDAVAKQEKRQNYVYLEGESKTTYHTSDVLTGLAAWYGERLHGNKTSSGEPFDCNKLTAAHRSLPFGTVLKVTASGPQAKEVLDELEALAARKFDIPDEQ